MMEPQIVVPPIEGGMERTPALGADEAFSMPQRPLHEVPVRQEEFQHQSSGPGPLKQLVNPDSLYRYLSWEDPARTLSSYAGVMAVLFGARYLPLTQTALKTGATLLGVVATVEYAHRSFTPNTLLARLRPRQYKKVPEPILNDTLKDVHDFVQYAVVLVQRIVLGEQLEKTFAAFVGLSALYWLVRMVSPFTLAVLSVNMLYLAPLVRTRRGREMIQETKVRAGELSNAALENAQTLANDSKDKASELSSQAQDSVRGAQRRVGELAQSGSQTAADVSAQIKDKVSDLSGSMAENASKVPQMSSNVAKQASDASGSAMNTARDTLSHVSANAASTMNNAKQQGYSAVAGTIGGNEHTDTAKPSGDVSKTHSTTKDDVLKDQANTLKSLPIDASGPANTNLGLSGQTNPPVDAGNSHYELKNTSKGLEDVTKSTPRQVPVTNNPFLNSMTINKPTMTDQTDATSIMDRPRAIPPADIDGAPVFGKFHEPEM